MKILHIGDIHLGCLLENQKRNSEIEKVFHHLTNFVRENQIKAALLAGDVFDKGVPSNESQELYYRFLLNLQQAGCRQVIVIAGNHDSSSFLDAPQALLKQMNIHIIGNVSPDDLEKEVIALGSDAAPEAYVCAVPYLNERDVRILSPEGESMADRDAAVARGIEKHYQDVFQIADQKRNGRNIPVIGMGHLYAVGSSFATADDSVSTAGNLNSVELSAFAEKYAYMALGHLHKPQVVKGHENWRYAGSILPMNLREHAFTPQIVLLDTADLSHPVIHELPAECFHEMKVIRGGMEELRRQLSELDASGRDIWIKAIYTGSEIRPNWAIELRQEFRERNVQIVLSEVLRKTAVNSPDAEIQKMEKSLAAMTPEELFLKHLDQKGEVTDPKQRNTYLKLFQESMLKVYDPAKQKEKSDLQPRRGVMKFERLYIKNVNSLYGENLIDFTVPEFNSGIFLITGNTGAGKSSILDAICLALFGATPRTKSDSKRSSISNQKNCVMSEGTHEMQTELTFSLGGNRYRACFRHRRTPNAQNPFAQVEHSLYKNDVLIADKATAARSNIENLIGMDQTQFCRCVLLAQGSFDAFLKAKDEERSDILKSITGTEIYSEIGKQINADFSEVKSKYELAKQVLAGITLLTEDEQKELQQRKEELAQKIQNCGVELKKKENIETIFLSIDQAKLELQKAAEIVAAAEKNSLDALPRRQELADANRAMNCENPFRQMQNICGQQQELCKTQTLLQSQLQQFEAEAVKLKETCAELGKKCTSLTEQQKSDGKLFQEIRLLDSRIVSSYTQYCSVEKELAAAKERLAKSQKDFQDAEKQWSSAAKEAGEAEYYCNTHAEDKNLSQLKVTWELRRTQIIAEDKRNADDKLKLDVLHAGLSAKKKEITRNQQNLRTVEEKRKGILASLEKSQNEMDTLLRGKTCQELRENWAAAMKLDELFKDSAQRQEYLTPETPCPLCGSVQHPYCEGTPVPDSREFGVAAKNLKDKITRIETCQQEIQKAESEKVKCEAEIASLRNKIAETATAAAAEETTEQEQTKIWNEHCRETAEKISVLTLELQEALQIQWQDRSALPEELGKRIGKFEKMNKILESLAEEKSKYEKACTVYATINPQNEEQVRQKEKIHSELAADLAKQEAERHEKFGKKNVDEEEKKIADMVDSCRKNLDAANSEVIKNQAQISHNKEDQQKTLAKQNEFASALKKAETEFHALLQQNNFLSLDDFSAKRRAPQYIQQLTAEIQKIDNTLNTGKGALTERQKILADTQAKLPENIKREENLQEMQHLRNLSKELQDKFNASVLKWNQDVEARKKYEEDGKIVAALSIEFNNWKYLDDNFGSAGADRFGRIAQGYTFSELLHFANNNRLRSLQNHFTLVNDDKNPLELNVIDHYRGGLIRTSRNLSGGESFEVSLALALGLAEMSAVSQNASLGNVLLDEGFGTLDDDALENSLELLMQLRRTNQKLVGIISHVSKLKERIATQIEVTSSGGMGSLSGAGVAAFREAAQNEIPKKRSRKSRKKDAASDPQS